MTDLENNYLSISFSKGLPRQRMQDTCVRERVVDCLQELENIPADASLWTSYITDTRHSLHYRFVFVRCLSEPAAVLEEGFRKRPQNGSYVHTSTSVARRSSHWLSSLRSMTMISKRSFLPRHFTSRSSTHSRRSWSGTWRSLLSRLKYLKQPRRTNEFGREAEILASGESWGLSRHHALLK